MGNELDNNKVWEIYRTIRRFENDNVRTQKHDDKEVVKRIVSYFEKIARREAENNEIQMY